MDRARNGKLRRRVGMEGELASGAEQRVLGLFGYVEGVDEYRTAGGVLMAEVRGGRVQGGPGLAEWMG